MIMLYVLVTGVKIIKKRKAKMNISTFLQIDLQNLFFEAKNKGQRIDFEKIWAYFNGRETEFLTNAYIYMIRGDDFDSSKFESKLLNWGYKIKIKTARKILL